MGGGGVFCTVRVQAPYKRTGSECGSDEAGPARWPAASVCGMFYVQYSCTVAAELTTCLSTESWLELFYGMCVSSTDDLTSTVRCNIAFVCVVVAEIRLMPH